VLHGATSSTHRALDGLAIVSEIYASPEPKAIAGQFADIVRSFKAGQASRAVPGTFMFRPPSDYTSTVVLEQAAAFVDVVRKYSPLVHQVRGLPRYSCLDILMTILGL
jgi:thiamine-phosphate diphosphorylase/hydroxyethylthiazole kinase